MPRNNNTPRAVIPPFNEELMNEMLRRYQNALLQAMEQSILYGTGVVRINEETPPPTVNKIKRNLPEWF
jgi:hypothetical protein